MRDISFVALSPTKTENGRGKTRAEETTAGGVEVSAKHTKIMRDEYEGERARTRVTL